MLPHAPADPQTECSERCVQCSGGVKVSTNYRQPHQPASPSAAHYVTIPRCTRRAGDGDRRRGRASVVRRGTRRAAGDETMAARDARARAAAESEPEVRRLHDPWKDEGDAGVSAGCGCEILDHPQTTDSHDRKNALISSSASVGGAGVGAGVPLQISHHHHHHHTHTDDHTQGETYNNGKARERGGACGRVPRRGHTSERESKKGVASMWAAGGRCTAG